MYSGNSSVALLEQLDVTRMAELADTNLVMFGPLRHIERGVVTEGTSDLLHSRPLLRL